VYKLVFAKIAIMSWESQKIPGKYDIASPHNGFHAGFAVCDEMSITNQLG